jgi:addiction module HigA family antidote
MNPADGLRPVHPGEIMWANIVAYGWNGRDFASYVSAPLWIVRETVEGKRSIDISMARKLSYAFDTTAQYWLNLQALYDSKTAKTKQPTASEQPSPHPSSAR